jgi:hypothetical protein
MISGRLAKIRAMPLREIRHRLAYDAYCWVERRRQRRGDFTRPDRLRSSLHPEIAGGDRWQQSVIERKHQQRFFGWEDDAEQVRRLFASEFHDEAVKARQIAAEVARHEVPFFGETFKLGRDVQWHGDPVSGAIWPQRYHRDVPCGRNSGCGDIKYVWELNRHQFLIDLGKSAFLDGSRDHADELTSLVDSWMAAAPYGIGAPWACALEPAFRAWSWLWAYRMTLASGLLSESAHLRWLSGFFDHGRFLYRHLEHYKSPFNHLIGEASALFALGLAFPEFRESTDWVRRGRTVLEGTIGEQFHPDGGTVEQSAFYHHATLGFYIMSGVLGRRHGQELSADVWAAIERAVAFSTALVQPDGRVPSIGGADDGKPIRLEHLPFWDFRPYYAIGAVLFRRGDFKAAAGRFWEDALWVLGSRAAHEFDAITSDTPTSSQVLPHSGYSIVRSSRSQDADYLLFDCGPQAGGLRRDSVPSAAHGHADCLSVIATLAGQRVLVDPGFFCYNGEPQWEVHFRKTPAHNTISIDGQDQARHVSKMAWTHTYEARLEETAANGTLGWARGSHDGYVTRAGVRHRRSVWLRPGGYVVILDELSGRTGGTATATFQFAPAELRNDGPDRVLFDGRFELAWIGTMPVTAAITRGGNDPTGGWIAPSLGVRVPAPRLTLTFPLRAEEVYLLTILADRQRAPETGRSRISFPAVPTSARGPLLAGHVIGQGWTDEVLAAKGSQPVEWLGVETDAPLAVLRVKDGGGGAECYRAGGSFARLHDAVRDGTAQPAVAGRRA